MPHAGGHAWTRIGTSILLIATALAGSYVAAAPAQAVDPILCSARPSVGPITTDDSFNAAVAEVNAGHCNVIDIAGNITFGTGPDVILPPGDLTLTIAGPPTGATLSGNDIRPGLRINPHDITVSSDLDLVVEDLTFRQFNGAIPGAGQAALEVQNVGPLTAHLAEVAFLDNDGVRAGGLHVQGTSSIEVTITGAANFTANSATFGPGALNVVSDDPTAPNTLTLGSEVSPAVITFANNSGTGGSGGIQAKDVTIYGGTFTANSTNATGGAISAAGNVTLTNTDFTGNTASGAEGGAVHAQGSVTVTGGSFDNNHVTSVTPAGAGGAFSANGDLSLSQVTNATFTNNSAVGNGGAIRTLGQLAVTDSTFRDGSAGNSGGAIAADDTITVTNSQFQDDTAAGSGGAIISIDASVFSQQSTYSGGTAGGSGGAISAGNGRVTSTDDTFTGNRTLLTVGDGGAIHAGRATITSSTFTGNTTARNGGAVSAAAVDDSGSTFTENSAADSGGAVHASLASSLTDSIFRDDSAAQGGAVYSYGPLTVTNSIFEDDTSITLGGAIVAYNTLLVESSTFERNVALQSGGAIFAFNAAFTTRVIDSLFENNEARGPDYDSNGVGGAILSSAPATVERTTFSSNTSSFEGGAISTTSSLTLTDDTFTNNVSVGRYGGAVHVAAPGTIEVNRSTFTGNSSPGGLGNGGAIWGGNAVNITDSTLSNNAAGNYGGAVFATTNVVVQGSTFSGNATTVRGGSVRTDGSASVSDSSFSDDTTGSSGAGGSLDVFGHLTLTRSTIRGSDGGQNGGGFAAGTATVTSSSLIDNEADNGGGAFIAARADIRNSTFAGNDSTVGGALFFNTNDPTPSTVVLSTLASNTAYPSDGSGFAIGSTPGVRIRLIGSVLAGAGPLCSDNAGPPQNPLNLSADSAHSFATNTSCGTGENINTTYPSLAALGLGPLTTDDTPGMQVLMPSDTAVVNSYVPLSALTGLPTPLNDQLGAPRNSPNGLTSAGAVQVRPISVTSPPNASVTAGSNATFSVTGYPGIGPTITYQWQSSTNGSTWSNVSGAQTATLTLPSVTQSQSGLQVRVLVADAYGNDDTSTTATLTVTTPTPGPAPTPTPTPTPAPSPSPEPIPSPIPPGGSLLQVDGRTVPVDVQPRPGNAGLRVQGEGWDMTLDGLNRDGQPLGVNRQGALVTDIGSGVRMGGSGFQPGSQIGFFLDPPVVPSTSTAYRANVATTDLGDITINADGRYSATIEMPDDIAPGPHVLQAVGVGTSGERRVLSLGIVVDAWIDLKRGKRTPAGRFDQVRATGKTGGLPAGAVLTPWVRSPGQDAFRRGSASITVRADGSFQWTRKVQKSKGLAAYVSYKGNDSNKVYWARLK